MSILLAKEDSAAAARTISKIQAAVQQLSSFPFQ
jgi:hypothetical protein